ncbi:MAG: hypothetical protein K2X03_19575 [Bryobacteraceae bacterium]|nr:hypothetical protein [Bryobacteraceae bacterium]
MRKRNSVRSTPHLLSQTNGEPLDTYISYQDDVNQSVTWNTISRVRTTMDGLGRPIKTEVLDPATSTVKSITDTEYDSCACSPAGKLKRQSMPYAPGGTVLWTTYVYDGLGRTLQVIQPHTSGTGSAGTTTYAYAGNKVTVTDPAGRWKRYLQNELGNLVQVTEPNPAGGADYQTYYTYNIRDQLTQVQMPRPDQVGGTYTQTRTFVYDLTTGWMTSATNPENGTTTYNYNFSGTLNYKQDAKGQRIEYLYDANNRVTKMTPKDSGGTAVTCDVVEYFYDLTQSTYGRLSATQWGSKDLDFSNSPICAKGLHREEYTYTNGGRITSKTLKLTRKFADISYEERTAQMSIAYDYTAGQFPNQFQSFTLNKVTYPTTYAQSGPQVVPVPGAVYQYTYDSQGRPTGETRDGLSLVDQVTYNVFGALTQMRKQISGGSQTETRVYDSFQRLTSMAMFDGTSIAYNYSQTANDGKIVSQTTGSETVNYTYDSLGRLSQAATAGAGGWGMGWLYDGWGNRLNQTAVKGSVPTMVTLTDPATNRIQSHTYDANGNTISTPQQGAMTYDVFNRLKTVASDTYSYDPGNKRIWKNDEYTFWGANGERVGRYSVAKLIDTNGGTPVHTFVFQKIQTDEYFGGRRLTTQDRLGSVGSYYPYGEAKSGSVSNADSFATYYRDSTGLDYAQQRFYAAGVGRFMTTDPLQRPPRVSAPSSLNLYNYTEADPVNRTDSKGLHPDDDSVENNIAGCVIGGVTILDPLICNTYGLLVGPIGPGTDAGSAIRPGGAAIVGAVTWSDVRMAGSDSVVDRSFKQLFDLLGDDSKCLEWLSKGRGSPGNASATLSAIFSYAANTAIGTTNGIVAQRAPNSINVGGQFANILINRTGAFFDGSANATLSSSYSAISDGLRAASDRYRLVVLLHELGHEFRAAGIGADGAADGQGQRYNNDQLFEKCEKTIMKAAN